MQTLLKSGSPMEPINQGFLKLGGAHAAVVVAVNEDGSPIGNAGGGAGTPVIDNAGVRWLWIYNPEVGTSTYISFITGSSGTPTFPLTPDSDTAVLVSNFPTTQQTQDKNGEGAVTYITSTTAVTGLAARQVVCLTDTVFATFTRTGATGSITGVSLPAGTLLTGPVTAITLTSGAVAAYA